MYAVFYLIFVLAAYVLGGLFLGIFTYSLLYRLFKKKWPEDNDYDKGTTIATVVGFAFFYMFLAVMIIGNIESDLSNKYRQKYTVSNTQLTALEDNTVTEGHRYYTQTQDRYYYMYIDSDGYKQKGWVSTAQIDENDRNDNRLECYSYKWDDEHSYLKYIFMADELSNEKPHYIIHCPKNTVTDKFNVDLK